MKKVTFVAKPQTNKQVSPDEWVNASHAVAEGPQAEAEPMKRLTIDVSVNLHRRIKMQCAARDTKIADEVRALLEKHFPEA